MFTAHSQDNILMKLRENTADIQEYSDRNWLRQTRFRRETIGMDKYAKTVADRTKKINRQWNKIKITVT